MKTIYKLLFSLALTFASVIAPSLEGRAGSGSSLHAQSIGEAFYIYRNDGHINGFLRSEVDSMAYSCYDQDSLLYDDYVMQVVYTQDSTYLIPLAAIDSVSFVQPKTVYQPEAVNLSDVLMPYVVGSDSLTIQFHPETPFVLLPQVGMKLATTEMNEKFPAGFAGQVTSVRQGSDGYVVECERVNLEDVFKTLYQVTSAYGYQEDDPLVKDVRQRVHDSGNEDFHLKKLTWNLGAELSSKLLSDLALKFSPSFSIEVTPVLHVRSTLIIDDTHGTYLSTAIKGDFDVSESLTYSGGIEWSKDILDRVLWVEMPVAPLTFFYWRPGVFLKANALLSGSIVASQHFTTAFTYEFSSKGQTVLKPVCSVRKKNSDADVQACVDGSLSAGLFLEAGLTILDSKLDKLCLRGELGLELGGHFMLYSYDIAKASEETKLYERLKESTVDLNLVGSVSGIAELGPFGVSVNLPGSLAVNLNSWHLVPSFLPLSWAYGDRLDEVTLTMTPSQKLIRPTPVGVVLFEAAGKPFSQKYAYKPYQDPNMLPADYSVTFSGLTPGRRYTAYPLVSFFNHDILASPSLTIGEDVVVETGEATEVTFQSATIAGRVSGEDAGKHECGVYYTKDGSEEWQVVTAPDRTADGDFAVQLADLDEDTKYIYYAYANMGGENIYGEQRSFTTTKSLKVLTGSATDITESSVVLHGQLLDADMSTVREYGIQYSTSPQDIRDVPATNIAADGTFSVTLEGLAEKTRYFYVAYAKDDTEEYYGEAQGFTTSEKEEGEDEGGEGDDGDDGDKENQSFTECPDANHPHMIDLGIGTLWSCCNVGASVPEQYGDYYAWGQTQPKSVYNDVTYSYSTGQDTDGDGWFDQKYSDVNIGSDISGTQYDAARANWGAPWRMPTLEECKKLVNSCISEWTTVNGVYGRKFTGPNGGTIFLPAAGYRWNDELHYVGTGYYWSSTLHEGRPWDAYRLFFYSGGAGADWNSYQVRTDGLSVRPVR